MATSDAQLERRAIRIQQDGEHPVYLFALTGDEILQVADISRVARDDAGKLIGYQRPAVKRHVREIAEYVDTREALFPHPIVLAFTSDVSFRSSRGPKASDGLASGGMLTIPLRSNGQAKPGWIVDGQQRALALSEASRRDFPVPVSAFVADSVDVQREQFLRINNARPLPRGLVTELLPEVSTLLPAKMAARRIPSALCDLLNQSPESPFHQLIRRPSTSDELRKQAVVTDTSVVKMLEESLGSTSGCLFPYRNIASNETDFDGIWSLLSVYWSAVRDTFPEAWGLPARRSRLMHGAGLRAMGRLMDKVMATVDPRHEDARHRVREDLELVAPVCRWTSGTWEELGGLGWNEVQNVPKHVRVLSNYLIREYVQRKMEVS